MIKRTPKKSVVGEFILRGQNSRLAPLRVRWRAAESLYYGGDLTILDGPVGLRSRFENRMSDRAWLKNNPDRVAGGRPFTESFFATVAVLMAFADAERLMIECTQSPVPMTQTQFQRPAEGAGDFDDFERSGGSRRGAETESSDPSSSRIAGTLRAS